MSKISDWGKKVSNYEDTFSSSTLDYIISKIRVFCLKSGKNQTARFPTFIHKKPPRGADSHPKEKLIIPENRGTRISQPKNQKNISSTVQKCKSHLHQHTYSKKG